MATKSDQHVKEYLKKQCIRDDEQSKEKATIYKYPLTKKSIAEGIYECVISPFKKRPSRMKEEKVVILLGATGVGKTTIINRMFNYIFDVNYTDTFRFQLIEETTRSEINSQTMDIHKYTIHHKKIPYVLSIIDTPGIGSTGGKMEDKSTVRKLSYLFESGIVENINAICMVEKYSTIRLTENLVYVFQTITKIFGKDVDDAIFILATDSNDVSDETTEAKLPPVVRFFNAQRIPFKKHFIFNNKEIYTKPITNTKSTQGVIESAFWEKSTNTYTSLFATIEATTPTSLKLTKIILQKKHNIINAKLPYFVRKVRGYIHEMETLEQDRRIIEETIANPDSMEEIEIEVIKRAMVDIEEPNCFSTVCKKCNVVCHYPCHINKGNLMGKTLLWCSAMTWFNPVNVHCSICPEKCNWKDHMQVKKREIFVTDTEVHTADTIKEIYTSNMKGDIGLVKKVCEEKMVLEYRKLVKDFKEIQENIDYINRNSLSKETITIKEFVGDVIDREEEAKEDGYKQRIHCLKRYVEMRDEDTSTNELHQAISLIQNMKIKQD